MRTTCYRSARKFSVIFFAIIRRPHHPRPWLLDRVRRGGNQKIGASGQSAGPLSLLDRVRRGGNQKIGAKRRVSRALGCWTESAVAETRRSGQADSQERP